MKSVCRAAFAIGSKWSRLYAQVINCQLFSASGSRFEWPAPRSSSRWHGRSGSLRLAPALHGLRVQREPVPDSFLGELRAVVEHAASRQAHEDSVLLQPLRPAVVGRVREESVWSVQVDSHCYWHAEQVLGVGVDVGGALPTLALGIPGLQDRPPAE